MTTTRFGLVHREAAGGDLFFVLFAFLAANFLCVRQTRNRSRKHARVAKEFGRCVCCGVPQRVGGDGLRE